MKRMLTSLTFAVIALPVQAACYADYKAKQEDPLRLHYGVAEIVGGCAVASAEQELRPRLAQAGWELLNVVSVFGAEGLDDKRDSAGPHFLAY